MSSCSTCRRPTYGYKCKQCGREMNSIEEYHACGREKIEPKCTSCGRVQTDCTCG